MRTQECSPYARSTLHALCTYPEPEPAFAQALLGKIANEVEKNASKYDFESLANVVFAVPIPNP